MAADTATAAAAKCIYKLMMCIGRWAVNARHTYVAYVRNEKVKNREETKTKKKRKRKKKSKIEYVL